MDAYDHLFDDDSDLIEAMEAYEDAEFADRAMELYLRREEQREFQRQLIEQEGGAIDPSQPGRFVFNLQPLPRRQNRRYGVAERNFNVQLRQEGNVVDQLSTRYPWRASTFRGSSARQWVHSRQPSSYSLTCFPTV